MRSSVADEPAGLGLQAALETCAAVAQEETAFAAAALQRAERAADDLREALALRRAPREAAPDATPQEPDAHLAALTAGLDEGLGAALGDARAALQRKHERAATFTVTLFGRTMAGKSTLREALTGGDGSSIGQGGQRTTRQVGEHAWGALRILDTPGIGAFEGAEDREAALAVIDESDLIVFLASSDGLQEDSFRGLEELARRGKPVLFALNVKRDLSRPVYLRRFLRDPGLVFADEQLAGHHARIRGLAAALGLPDARVVPLHAQAAFLAGRPALAEHAAALRAKSRVGDLVGALAEEIAARGAVIRLEGLLDGAALALAAARDPLRARAQDLRRAARYLRDKGAELDVWLDAFARATRARIAADAAALVQPLRAGASAFVDEHLERADVAEQWRQRVAALDVGRWMEREQQIVIDELRSRMDALAHEVQLEASLLGVLDALDVRGPERYDPLDLRRALRWTSAGTAAVAGVAATAAWISVAAFWTPLGWAAGAASFAALGLSWFIADRERKLTQRKAQTAADLRRQLDALERRIADELGRWFEEAIERGLLAAMRRDARATRAVMLGSARALGRAASLLDREIAALHLRRRARAAELLGAAAAPSDPPARGPASPPRPSSDPSPPSPPSPSDPPLATL